MGKYSVICQQEKSGCVLVQPSDREKPAPLPLLRHGVHDRGLARIACRRQHTGRFVQHDVYMARAVDQLAIDGERDSIRIEFLRRIGARYPVYGCAPATDDLPRLTA